MTYTHKILEIAGLTIAVESAIPFELSNNCRYFEMNDGNPDLTIYLERLDDLDLLNSQIIYDAEGFTTYQRANQVLRVRYSDFHKTEVCWCLSRMPAPNSWLVQIRPCWEDNLKNLNPLFFFELSDFLIEYNAMILHSSVISYHGKGIVFTAPSGTGKSTQASLWKKYYGCSIINGDRTIIRNLNEYRCYGSPYAGSSGIFKNESVKLQVIVVLRQAKENRIRKLGVKEAYINLLSEMSISRWNKATLGKQMDWLLRLVENVAVYRLDCLPNREAVDLLYHELGE